MQPRNRIIDYRIVRAGDLVPDPRNWRVHGPAQREALTEMLDRIGYADAVICRQAPDGTIVLIDGHLRAGLDDDAQIPCLLLDVDEAEAGELLLSLDPLAAMAQTSERRLQELLQQAKGLPDALLANLAGPGAPMTPEDVRREFAQGSGGLEYRNPGVRDYYGKVSLYFLTEADLVGFCQATGVDEASTRAQAQSHSGTVWLPKRPNERQSEVISQTDDE